MHYSISFNIKFIILNFYSFFSYKNRSQEIL
nr:MAG TPA: hypothetical protein [Caudoviricetes sp.]